ncbi:hypothetical protein [Aeromicrobium yanjiei]|uniref:Uncharacterized protein n=1 Tax=Aeromicrobium yanjiei TaxID=2662028 RepID=A0A5Q2MDW1_9ACTN|nr:hypothetical protein [Aeromicrobium yanjiei]QGG39889.1 hypothetical protein GEV26_00020 [Aeromicrobium yanjiei]
MQSLIGRDLKEATLTITVALRGALNLWPWIVAGKANDSLPADDTFSLAIVRAVTIDAAWPEGYGVSSTRWHQGEAGEDWTSDGQERELCWLQIEPLVDPNRPLPTGVALSVLSDVLGRIGDWTFSGAHAVVPIRQGVTPLLSASSTRSWFELGDPQNRRDFNICVSLEGQNDDVLDTANFRDSLNYYGAGLVSFEDLGGHSSARRITGDDIVHSVDNGLTMWFSCQAREWTVDLASWVIDLVGGCLRENGATGFTAISVQSSGRFQRGAGTEPLR